MPNALRIEVPPQPIETWKAHYASNQGHRYWPCEELVRALAGKRHFNTLMEVGCGNGANLWMLAEHADEVVGVDSCPEALKAASSYMRKRNTVGRVQLVESDIRRLPRRAGTTSGLVDVMTSQHVPLSEQAELLHGFWSALKPGGWYFRYALAPGCTMTDAESVELHTYKDLPKLFPGTGPVFLPPEARLHTMLLRAGFTILRQSYITREYHGGAVARYSITEAHA